MSFDWAEIEVISFDLDDTLWHCEPVLVKAELALRQFWLDRGHEAMHRGLTTAAMMECANQVRVEFPDRSGDVSFVRVETLKRLAAQHCQFASQSELDLTCQLAFDEFFHHRTLHVSDHFFPGSLDALRRIRNLGLRVGTISNGNAQVDKIPELAGLVECHVSPALHPVLAKPGREPFDLLRAGLGNVEAHKVLHVGDSVESDVSGAIGAGMRSCWVNLYGESAAVQCNLVVSSVAELADLLEQWHKTRSE